MPPALMTDYVTTDEAAKVSGYHPDYVRRLARQQKIAAQLKGGQYWIDVDSLRAYLARAAELGNQRFNWHREDQAGSQAPN